MNDYQFKLVKLEGEFVWHSHADTDEVFLVVDGAMSIEFRDGRVELQARRDVRRAPRRRTQTVGARPNAGSC